MPPSFISRVAPSQPWLVCAQCPVILPRVLRCAAHLRGALGSHVCFGTQVGHTVGNFIFRIQMYRHVFTIFYNMLYPIFVMHVIIYRQALSRPAPLPSPAQHRCPCPAP